ncbi:MAG: class I SAM-dependent methyltransferase [Tissierellia bacterium]|nr:class I SAM-dependent methyltransferase [Bacillota bacterium]NLL23714.1 class I SAM-dependent methyltransferase [Tissierellia bacterium]
MYNSFAQIYDQLMDDFPYDELIGAFSSLYTLKGRMLEMGCGSGRITQKLLPRSREYWALDVSEEMLSLAASRLGNQQGLHLMIDQGEEFSRELDVVLAAVDVVNYMQEEEIESFFSRSFRALVPGGALLFDISTEKKIREELAENVFIYDEEEFALIWQNQFVPEERGVYFDLLIFIREGERYRKEREYHFQRAWKPSEIREALFEAGFSSVEMIETMERQIFCAVKRDGGMKCRKGL